MKHDVTVHASSLLSTMKINVRVSGVRVASLRLWLAAALIRCAALVLGCAVVTDRERPSATGGDSDANAWMQSGMHTFEDPADKS